MMAWLFLAAAWSCGDFIVCRLLPGARQSWQVAAGPDRMDFPLPNPAAKGSLPARLWPLLRAIAGLWTGLMAATWLVYALACLTMTLRAPAGPLPAWLNPWWAGNGLIWLLGLLAALPRLRRLVRSGLPAAFSGSAPPRLRGLGAQPERSDQRPLSFHNRSSLLWLLAAVSLTLVFTGALIWRSLHQDGQWLTAGASTFSDLAPHTALTSAFAHGENFPAAYPHFAADGIRYHFLFYVLCGNLHHLGFSLALALNLPSTLAFASWLILLGLFGWRVTGKRAVAVLAPLFAVLRSSAAFFTNLLQLRRTGGGNWFARLWEHQAFIGGTPRDDWGLWTINVYPNQRHLNLGLTVLLLCLILIWPDAAAGVRRPLKQWFDRSSWLVGSAADRRRHAYLLLLLVMLPYWHGSALIGLLSILFVLAFPSVHKLAYLALAAGATASALLQGRLLSGTADAVIKPSFQWGFIVESPDFAGILRYFLELGGLLLPLVLLTLLRPGAARRLLILAAIMPIVLAFTVSLTPDITVNHKYIQLSLLPFSIISAEAVRDLFAGKPGKPKWRLRGRRVAAVLLAALLTVTGLYELRLYHNINQTVAALDLEDPLTAWLKTETAPSDLFLTAPYHYNSFFLSGRKIWFGHGYYAWSAGHNTDQRFADVQRYFAAADPERTRRELAALPIRYLIIDDALRQNTEITLNEAFFAEQYPLAATFPERGQTLVYDLKATAQPTERKTP